MRGFRRKVHRKAKRSPDRVAANDLLGLCLKDPLHQVVDILKVVVERLAVEFTVIGDVFDRNLVERLF